jgi:CspA family cold shock protein
MPVTIGGTVETFDAELGLGTVRGEDGRTYGFHCTQIADGSRRVEPGAAVRFDVVAGHLGRWEAAALRPA